MAAEPLRGAQARVAIIGGVEPPIHARLLVGAGEQVAEQLERLLLQLVRERIETPSLARGGRGAGTLAIGQKRAGEREAALRAQRPRVGEIGPHGRRGRALLPQHGLGPLAEHDHAGPSRVRLDERIVAGEFDAVVVVAQDHPFDQLAGGLIGNAALDFGRVIDLAGSHQTDRMPDGLDVRFGDGSRRRGRERHGFGSGRRRVRCDRQGRGGGLGREAAAGDGRGGCLARSEGRGPRAGQRHAFGRCARPGGGLLRLL